MKRLLIHLGYADCPQSASELQPVPSLRGSSCRSPIQHSILHIRCCDCCNTDEDDQHDMRPAFRVEWAIVLLEQLRTDDPGGVRAHDEDCHRDGTLAGGWSIESHPGAVYGMPDLE